MVQPSIFFHIVLSTQFVLLLNSMCVHIQVEKWLLRNGFGKVPKLKFDMSQSVQQLAVTVAFLDNRVCVYMQCNQKPTGSQFIQLPVADILVYILVLYYIIY